MGCTRLFVTNCYIFASQLSLSERGVIVVGNEGGSLFVINQRTSAEGSPTVVQRYNVGQTISSVSRDASNARYIAVAGGRLFAYPLYLDTDGFR